MCLSKSGACSSVVVVCSCMSYLFIANSFDVAHDVDPKESYTTFLISSDFDGFKERFNECSCICFFSF